MMSADHCHYLVVFKVPMQPQRIFGKRVGLNDFSDIDGKV